MIPEYEISIHVRIPKKHREEAEKLIEAGKFRNLSEVVREAIREFLEGAKNEEFQNRRET